MNGHHQQGIQILNIFEFSKNIWDYLTPVAEKDTKHH